MVKQIGDDAIATRKLIVRDAVSILVIVLTTAGLFALTLFLFRSFTTHRAELAQRWSERGQRALQADKPDEAIADLRTALSYAPGTRPYELLLAQALGRAGRTEESYNYFLGLWETAPGDANINLALARLAAHKGDRAEAINYYRAAIYGTWEQGDGVERRAAVRAELARYLIDQHELQSARDELLIAGGNTPDDYQRDLEFGRLFEAALDPKDAEVYYQKAIAVRPEDATALEAAGRLAYAMSDYSTAHRLLDRAASRRNMEHSTDAATDAQLAQNAARLIELNPAAYLPERERVSRIVTIRSIARKRFDLCKERLSTQPMTPALQALASGWSGPDALSNTTTLLRDPARQETALQLSFDTERELQALCGTPAGDDALILRLATTSVPRAGGQSE